MSKSQQNQQMLERENEEQRRRISAQDAEIKDLRRSNVKYERRWAHFGKEKSCIITIPVLGTPTVELDGQWTKGYARDAYMMLLKKIGEQMVKNRLEIERGIKNSNETAKNADNQLTEAENPSPAPQMAVTGVPQEKKVTDD